MLSMIAVVLNIGLALLVLATIWQAGRLALKGAVWLVEMAVVTIVQAPIAYAAAKAEWALPKRDLAFDYEGSAAEAKLFDSIVQDRLVRTRMAHERPAMTYAVTHFSRRIADQAGGR